MTKVDMHVHSLHSKHPSEWFLQRIGASESYTSVEEVYRLAKKRGMQFVTLTDHNTIDGALELRKQHPDDTFISVEITSYFPENGCKVHILAYHIDEAQFQKIQELRLDLYALRDFLRAESIACSVAHATYNVNGRLSEEILEKLILLFDVFEIINGARSCVHNQAWHRLLQHLSSADIEHFSRKHQIDPWGANSWVKGFTGGSDDHAGLLIGAAYTLSDAHSVKELMDAVRNKSTLAGGRHGDHKSLAFAIYKIATEYSSNKKPDEQNKIWQVINTLAFSEGKPGLRDRFAISRMKLKRGDDQQRILSHFFEQLIEGREQKTIHPADMIQRLYDSLSNLTDDFFKMIVTSLEKNMRSGDSGQILKNIAAALPALFLSAPFFTALRHHHRDKNLITNLHNRLISKPKRQIKRVLWFSDTVNDLNGVSVTMRELTQCATLYDYPFKLVSSLPTTEVPAELADNMLNLPCIYTAVPDFYTSFTLRVPSLLRSVDLIAMEQPDEIMISTPGPVGLLGLLCGWLTGTKCTGIYHTDFTRQVDQFIGDEWISSMVETYTRFFYNALDEIRVPTRQYMEMLESRGLPADKMRLFKRSLDPTFAIRDEKRENNIKAEFKLTDAPVLVWAGRLGKEKNIDFMLDVVESVMKEHTTVQFLIIGDGPELQTVQQRIIDMPRVIMTGRIPRSELPLYFNLADLFVFPSTTDTFGMVILEAQACGVPVLVSDVGGPQELVHHGQSGYVLPANKHTIWKEQILHLLTVMETDPSAYDALRSNARQTACSGHGWRQVLEEMMAWQSSDGTALQTESFATI
ncbi:MAG: glycosyltransferase [Spartobacteria bacterium]|nr:glycosyltransferase [Spartobacteria bacterium]